MFGITKRISQVFENITNVQSSEGEPSIRALSREEEIAAFIGDVTPLIEETKGIVAVNDARWILKDLQYSLDKYQKIYDVPASDKMAKKLASKGIRKLALECGPAVSAVFDGILNPDQWCEREDQLMRLMRSSPKGVDYKIAEDLRQLRFKRDGGVSYETAGSIFAKIKPVVAERIGSNVAVENLVEAGDNVVTTGNEPFMVSAGPAVVNA